MSSSTKMSISPVAMCAPMFLIFPLLALCSSLGPLSVTTITSKSRERLLEALLRLPRAIVLSLIVGITADIEMFLVPVSLPIEIRSTFMVYTTET